MTVASELRRAMITRGATIRGLAALVGRDQATVAAYRTGRRTPSLEAAAALADALMWPGIVDAVRADRTRACVGCGVTIMSQEHGGPRRRYCGGTCKGRVLQRQARRSIRTNMAATLFRTTEERDTLREAVRAMCLGCEPEGLCRDAECPLRSVSPLSLSRVRVA